MNPYNFAVLFFAFCSFLISILVWLKQPDAVGKWYFIFSLSVTIWGIGFSFMANQYASYSMALFFDRVANIAAVFIPVTWLHFILIFTNQKKYQILLKILYLLSFFIDLFGFSPWFIPCVRPIAGFIHYPKVGPIFHFFTATFFLVVPLGFIELGKAIKHAEGKEKFRLKGFMIATMFGFIGGSFTFLPGYEIPWPQYGLFLMPIYPFAMAYFISRRQLFNIEDLAQAAHRDKLAAIGTLATSINHEIRNPLYVIQGLAESHLANFADGMYPTKDEIIDKSNEILRKTVAQSTRAMEIMKRFAVFAKQEINQQPATESVDLNETLEDILPLVNHEMELDKVELVKNIPADLAPVWADRRHLEEILFNLIVNACQAMKGQERKGRIEIGASQYNGSILVQIEDNGPGIPSNFLAQIFEPFYTTKSEGTGLGLYVTKQLMEKNGGKISVKSKPGQGAKFTLEFSAK